MAKRALSRSQTPSIDIAIVKLYLVSHWSPSTSAQDPFWKMKIILSIPRSQKDSARLRFLECARVCRSCLSWPCVWFLVVGLNLSLGTLQGTMVWSLHDRHDMT